MSSEKRRYQMQARAARQRETRERIVAATVALHRDVGPARTTIADIARRAGVERLTVYNHFARLGDLLAACQADFIGGSPPPEMMPRAAGGDPPLDRLETMLARLFAWFRANRAMERNVTRDRRLVPELDELLKRTADPRFDAAAGAWAREIAHAGRRDDVRALVRLAIDFATWDLLAEQRLGDRRIAALWRSAIAAAGRAAP